MLERRAFVREILRDHVFRRDLRMGTLILWLTFFMSLLVIYTLTSWLPLLLSSIGVSFRAASLITAMFLWGGTLSGVILDALAEGGVVIGPDLLTRVRGAHPDDFLTT